MIEVCHLTRHYGDLTAVNDSRYTFNGHAGQWVTLGLTSVGVTSSSISLLSEDGTTRASTAVGTAGGALEVPNPLPATGTYTILVRPGATYTGNMTLTLSTEVSDSLKLNAAPRPITISRAGQNGRYTFAGTANQQVTIKVTNNKIGNVTVNLYTPSGVLQAGTTSSAARTSGRSPSSRRPTVRSPPRSRRSRPSASRTRASGRRSTSPSSGPRRRP